MNIAVRSPNWIGDGIMCIPALEKLKETHPGAEITLVCSPYLIDLFRSIPVIDRFISLSGPSPNRSFWQTIKKLRHERFDLGVLFTNSFSSALLFRLAAIRPTAGYRTDGRGFLLDRSIRPPRINTHHARYYLNLIETLNGLAPDESFAKPRLVFDDAEKESRSQMFHDLGITSSTRVAGFAPAAAYGSAKCWLPDRFRELMLGLHDRLPDLELMVFGSTAEKPLIEKILAGLPFPVHNLAGAYSLRESLLLLSRVDLMVANDSGLMHAAAALDRPLVALFGPTKPWQTKPLTDRATVIYHAVECAPCSYRDCPYHHGCMSAISVEEALSACERILSRPRTE